MLERFRFGLISYR